MDPVHYRCVGIGVGPANLSLASLLHGHDEVPNLFLDKKKRFTWHDGQQLPGTSLQVSLFKDLVSLADPTNPFSFLSYLHDQGKIYHFLNAQFDVVPRLEFRNYLEWASHRNENVVFGEEVQSVEFDGRFVVRTNRRAVAADNISLGVGTQPWVPAPVQHKLGSTHFHVSDFMTYATDLTGKRVCVVGGGQSGAEAFLDLISRPDSSRPQRVSWVSRRSNFLPIDDSPFTNDFYMPYHSDYFFSLDRDAREVFNNKHLLSSDGISESTLREIYQRIYLHRFVRDSEGQITLYPNREVTGVVERDAGTWELMLSHHDQPHVAERLTSDVVVWATGYRPASMDFLAPIAGRLEREDKEYRIDRDFAVCWDGPSDRNIFLHNAASQQRGLADRNLSLNAWRSQRVVDRLRGLRTTDQLAPFVEWAGSEGFQGV